MEDHYKLLRTEDLHSQCIELIKNCIVEIQQEICIIKKFLGDQKKEVIKQIKFVHNFYNFIIYILYIPIELYYRFLKGNPSI